MKSSTCNVNTSLIEARRKMGLSRADMAKKINMDKKEYIAKENGEKSFRLHDMLKIRDVIHISLDELFG
jgi:DNA-binding XRE family transcriptional regulator